MGEAKRRGSFDERRASAIPRRRVQPGLVDYAEFRTKGRAALLPPACGECGGELSIVPCEELQCGEVEDEYHVHSRCSDCAGVFTTLA